MGQKNTRQESLAFERFDKPFSDMTAGDNSPAGRPGSGKGEVGGTNHSTVRITPEHEIPDSAWV